jgi:uncharacterized protein YjlB
LLDAVQQHISIVPSYPAGKSYDISEKENEKNKREHLRVQKDRKRYILDVFNIDFCGWRV